MPHSRADGPPTVTLTLGSAGHQRSLADALLHAGMLRGLVRFGPEIEILECDGAGRLKLLRRFSGYQVANRLIWGIWRRLPVLKRRAPIPIIGMAWAADTLTSKWLPTSDIFHGMMGVCLASLRRAQRFGAVTLVDQATLHPVAWQREVLADCGSAGVRPEDCERLLVPMQIRRQEREYEICDKIVVYSRAAARSFDGFPYAHKAAVVQPGVDHQLFVPSPGKRRESVFRICYVGRIEAAKGVHYLIDAWKRLALRDAELVLAGRVLPEMAWLSGESAVAGFRLAGILSPEGVAKLYQESDAFVFPSMNEGLSLALLEAMSAGLPVIACHETGAEDCVRSGENGWLVAGRDVDALSRAILRCYEQREELAAMGAAARLRIEQEFTFSHYAGRLMELYRSIGDRR